MKISNPLVRGFYTGLLAGIIGGVPLPIFRIIEAMIELYGAVPHLVTYDFLIFHLGYAVGLHGLLGAIWGVIYSILYDGIPGKGIKKGFVYGCIVFFISDIYIASTNLSLGLLTWIEEYFIWTSQWAVGGAQLWIIYGIVLGALYKRWSL